ncbi:MAG: ABC transporter ATP-binding protein [Solirubrobacteraceae bacterium]
MAADARATASDAPPISVRGLVKRYGDVTAVAGVDLTVEAGDVYGYLGPNGAGKTTVLRMLLGLIRPTSGEVRVFGRDPQSDPVGALRGVAGFVEAPKFYPYMTGRKNLELLADLDGGDARSRIGEALDLVELTERAKHKVGGYSHGMRQRLGVAAALLRNPQLLLLDEPATGLDPAGMRDMRALVARLSQAGTTVLLSSHLLNEVEELCNRVAIVRTGTFVFEGRLDELRASMGGDWRLRTTDDVRALAVLAEAPGITNPRADGLEVRFDASEAAVEALSVRLVEAGLAIRALAPHAAALEDLFFSLTEGDANAGAVQGPGAAGDPEGASGDPESAAGNPESAAGDLENAAGDPAGPSATPGEDA